MSQTEEGERNLNHLLGTDELDIDALMHTHLSKHQLELPEKVQDILVHLDIK